MASFMVASKNLSQVIEFYQQKCKQLTRKSMQNQHFEEILKIIFNCLLDKELLKQPFIIPKCLSNFVDTFNLFLLLTKDYSFLIIEQLSKSEFTQKYLLLLIFKSLFSIKLENIHLSLATHLYYNFKGIWKGLLLCFLDPEQDIRLICLKIASIIFKTEHNRKLLISLRKKLISNLNDEQVPVRLMSLEVVNSIKQEDVILPIFEQIFHKVSDIDLGVRKTAIRVVGQIFQKYWKKIDFHYAEQDSLYKLASACILRYTSEEDEEEELVKEVTQIDFIDCNSSSQNKALRLLYLLIFCHDSAVQNLGHILIHQSYTRKCCYEFIKFLSSSDHNKEKFNLHLSIINQHFIDIYGHEEFILNFFSQINNDSFENYELLFGDKLLESDQVINFLSQFLKIDDQSIDEEQDPNLTKFHSAIVLRTGLYLFDKNMLLFFLDEINRFAQSDEKFIPRLASIITFISNIYAIFEDADIYRKFLNLNEKILMLLMTNHLKPYLIGIPNSFFTF